MRLVSLTLCGYRQVLERTTLELPQGLIGICGPNGVGKSKLIEGIGYALYGWQRRLMPRGDRVADLHSRGAAGGAMRVELVLELWGQRYEIVRSPRETTIRLVGARDSLAATPTGVTAKAIELLGLPPAAYAGTFVARQREIAGLQSLAPDPRRRLVNRLIGIAQVEAAIRLAEKEHAGRKAAWKAVADLVGPSPEAATEELETIRRERAGADALVEGHESVRAIVDARVAAARDIVAALRGRTTQVAALRERVADGDRHRADLERGLAGIRGRLTRAQAAEDAMSTALAVLHETADAPAALELRRALAAVADLRASRREVGRELNECILPRGRERAAILTALAADERVLQALQDELAEEARAASLAMSEALRADADADGLVRRSEAARRLGPEGVCDVCGQAYGSSLGHALAHFSEELSAARGRAAEARARARLAQVREGGVRGRIAERTDGRDKRRVSLGSYDAVPGDEARTREELRRIDAALAATPQALLAMEHVPELLTNAESAVAKRATAETDVARLAPLAADLAPAEFEETEALLALTELARRFEDLHSEIARIEPTMIEIHAADDELAAACAEQTEASSATRDARAAATAWATRETLARAALDAATERAAQIAVALGALRVAERTEEVLRRLLAEIAAEARPRLIDMLDGWARALLGPRIRGIDLTEDYRIRADSGSGWREIEHFSGGEQTLLAIMLRVAISLFCQERAGFDRGILILDEVFGDQDGDHRAQLVQFLGEVGEHFHQVLVVNHIEDVTEMLDSIIEVRPVSHSVSTASLRR